MIPPAAYTEIDRLVDNWKPKRAPFIPGESYIRYAEPYFDNKEYVAVIASLLEGWLGLSTRGKILEEELAVRFGKLFGILTNSGSSANLLAITALGLEEGSTVITPACCFPTTVNPIIQNNLIPIFIDVDLGTYTLKLEDLEKTLKHNPKALVFAHTLGNITDMDMIEKFCKENKILLVEDCCDAIGGTFGENTVGSFGDMATLSLYPAHHITMGEGGYVACKSEYYSELKSLRDWGRACHCDGE